MKIETAVHQFLGHLEAVKRRSPATTDDGQVSKLLAAASLIEKTMILTLATASVRRAEL